MTAKRQIIISSEDQARLESLFHSRFATAFEDKPYLQSLRGELDDAQIIHPDDMPPDVVTMNSTVRLREVGSKNVETYTLVYPQDANIAEDKLSVLAPIGTAILGYRVGDLVRWNVPSGVARFRIQELVFQPERDCVAA
ncbi:MAG: nucleoside diphosphate kinase regulator [Planctomycetaceae bacterium]|nr:nucleoside diphosphate kinase regulator [Planctomycetaceae bacterium]